MTGTGVLKGGVAVLAFASVVVAASSALAHDAEPGPRLDLTLYGGAIVSSRSDPQVSSVGLSLGLSAFVRLGSLLGLGLVAEHDQFSWDALGPMESVQGSGFPNDDATITYDMVLLATRLYFAELGPADLFGQLGVGYGGLMYAPQHPDCSAEDGLAVQLALGVEWRLSRLLGLHSSVAAWPFGWGLGCNDIGYEGKPPDAPALNLGLAARIGLTTTWTSP